MTRLLGIDLGERRIGIAIADEGGRIRAVTTLRRSDDQADDAVAIGRLVGELRAEELVVGLPLDSVGGEGPQAMLTRSWAEAIAGQVGVPVAFRDERHTTQRAAGRLGRPSRGRSGGPPGASRRNTDRARLDREAAVLILQDELDARAASARGGDAPETGDGTIRHHLANAPDDPAAQESGQ